jgi:hypothetical protein
VTKTISAISMTSTYGHTDDPLDAARLQVGIVEGRLARVCGALDESIDGGRDLGTLGTGGVHAYE